MIFQFAPILFWLSFMQLAHSSSASDDDGLFSTEYIEQVDNVSLIQFFGDYNQLGADGEFNVQARRAVAKEFYQNNPDIYDFLVVFTDFEIDTGEARAFHHVVSNSVAGIGIDERDNTELYGSDGKLKGFIDMAALTRYQTNSLAINPLGGEESYEVGLNVLAHELLHQWAAFPAIEELQGRDGSHWNFYLNTDASVQYGSRWRDNSDGTFTAVGVQEKYSQLDLYLMGLIDKAEVEPFYVIRPAGNDDYDISDFPVKGAVVNGTRKDYSVDDLIAAQGERTPSFADSQKEFKFAFLYLSSEARIEDRIYAEINELKKEFATRFSILTSGRAIANVDPVILVSAPVSNQPVLGPNGDVGLQTQASEKAVAWLLAEQNANGSWNDKEATRIRDTSVVLNTLINLGDASEPISKARNWLGSQAPDNTDSVSRRLQITGDVNELARLLTLQNDDGGWGLQAALESSVMDTSLAICAIATLNPESFADEIQQGIDYVLNRRDQNGAWSINQSQKASVALTSRVLTSLNCAGISPQSAQPSIDWLASQVNDDSGFGDAGSTVRETADAVGVFIAFRQLGKLDIGLALDYILSQQGEAGDWGGSVSTTARILDTLRISSLPNLVTSSVVVQSDNVLDGEIVKVLVTLENNGAKTAQASVLSLYQGGQVDGNLIDELRLPPIAPFRQLEVAFYWNSLGTQGTVELNAVADTLSEVNERSEGDNIASTQVEVSAAPQGAELLVNKSQLRSTPTQVNVLPTTVSINAVIHNIGTAAANNVTVQLWEQKPFDGELLGSKAVSLLARSVEQLTFDIDKTNPADQEFFIVVDPQNSIDEENESNNSASLIVGSSSTVDLSVSADDLILPTAQPLVNEAVELGAVIRNRGTVAANDVPVRVYVTNVEGEFEVVNTTLNIEPGQTVSVSDIWSVNVEGQSSLRVEVDPANALAELDESNNTASVEFNSKRQAGQNVAVNFQEFSILPEIGLQGMGSTLRATVRNTGTEPVNNLAVAFYVGNPTVDGRLIAQDSIQSIAASSSYEVALVWPEVDYQGANFIYVLIDPNNQVDEFDEQDNQAFIEYEVISLPDLAVSADSLSSEPRFPSANVATEYVVTVTNRGMQAVSNATIQAYLGTDSRGVLIAESSIDVANSGQAQWAFEYTFTEQGEQFIHVVLDAQNAIRELSESNNQLTKAIAVQDRNFFLSNLFISPDSDGVQDTVDYTFNLPQPSEASVVVINDLGDEVFEYEFDTPIQSERVSWDGKNRFGGNVADGTYTLAVKRGPNIYTGERDVIVDVNRSPLSEAFGTQFGLERNLTCRIGEVRELDARGADSLIYSPDNRHIYFNTLFNPFTNADGETVETDALHPFPTGLYRAESNGSGVTQIVSAEDLKLDGDRRLIKYFTTSLDGDRLLTRTVGAIGGDFISRFLFMSPDGSDIRSPQGAVPSSQGVSNPIPLPDNKVLFWYDDGGCCEVSQSTKQVRITQDAENATPQLVFDAAILGAEKRLDSITVNSKGTHFVARVAAEDTFSTFQFDNPYTDVGSFFLNPPVMELILVDIESGLHTPVSEQATAFAWSPNGDLLAVAMPERGVIEVFSTDLRVMQSVDLTQIQWPDSAPVNAELRAFGESLFDTNTELTERLIGSVTEISWNPDGSEFALLVEDFLSFASLLNFCGNEFVPSSDPICAEITLSNGGVNHAPTDGVYIAKLDRPALEKVASMSTGETLYISTALGLEIGPEITQDIPIDSSSSLTAESKLFARNTNGVPLAQGLPLIEHRHPLLVNNDGFTVYYASNTGKPALLWLDGGRELLVNPTTFRPGEFNVISPPRQPLADSPFAPLSINASRPIDSARFLFPTRNFEAASNDVTGVSPTPFTKFLSFYSNDTSDKCGSLNESKGYRQFQSLLNLTADLRVLRSDAQLGLRLEGSAIDKNFERYELHYRDSSISETWTLIAPPSSAQVIDSRFTTWVPPYRGSFFVRLRVFDKAGNQREVIRRAINSEQASISGVFLSEQVISPNSDGVKDTTALNFRILNNVNVVVEIFNQGDTLIRRMTDSYNLIGSEESIVWDGRDSNGARVPDGIYRIVIQGYEFFVDVDTTFPVVRDISLPVFKPIEDPNGNLESGDCFLSPPPSRQQGVCFLAFDFDLAVTVDELNPETVSIEYKELNQTTWINLSQRSTFSESGNQTVSDNVEFLYESNANVDAFRKYEYRAVAMDKAGNKSVIRLGENKTNRAHFTRFERVDYDEVYFDYRSSEEYRLLIDDTYQAQSSSRIRNEEELRLGFTHTVVEPIDSYELHYRSVGENGAEVNGAIAISPTLPRIDEIPNILNSVSHRNSLEVIAETDKLPVSFTDDEVELFIRMHTKSNGFVDTNTVLVKPNFGLRKPTLRGHLLPNFNVSIEGPPRTDILQAFFSLKSTGVEADPRFVDDQEVFSNLTQDPEKPIKLNGRLIRTLLAERNQLVIDPRDGSRLGRVDNNSFQEGEARLNITDNCGTNYLLTAQTIDNEGNVIVSTGITRLISGQEVRTPDGIIFKGTCTDLDVDVTPVFTNQCEAAPSNTVTVSLSPIDKTEIDGSDRPIASILKLGLPDRTPQELESFPESFRVGRVLYAENLPEFGVEYQYELDTSLFPEGKLELIAELTLEDGTTIAEPVYVPVVKTLPELSLSYPNDGSQLCALDYERTVVNQNNGRSEVISVKGVEVSGDLKTVGPDALISFDIGGVGNDFLGSRVRFLDVDSVITPDQISQYLSTKSTVDPDANLSQIGCREIGCNYGLFKFNGVAREFDNNGNYTYERSRVVDDSINSAVRVNDGNNIRLSPIHHDYLGYQSTASGVLAIPVFNESGTINLTNEVRNWSGASVCSVTSFSLDAEVEGFAVNAKGGITRIIEGTDNIIRVFAPNSDELYDTISYEVTIDEPVSMSLSVRNATEQNDSPEVIAEPINDRSLAFGIHAIEWDGRGDDNEVLEDGVYEVVLTATDGCGHTKVHTQLVEIDTTPARVEFEYPLDSEALPILVRILGQVREPISGKFVLSVKSDQGVVTKLNEGVSPVSGPVGNWNTFGLEGNWTLLLESTDLVGNKSSVEQSLSLPIRQDLIASLATEDYFVSPNQDGRLDTLSIRVGLLREANISVLIKNQADEVIRTLVRNQTQPEPYSTVIWDGKNDTDQVPPDGIYTVELTASNPTNQQTERIQFELDNTLPTIIVNELVEPVIELAGADSITGTILDSNFKDLKVVLEPLLVDGETGDSSIVILEESQRPKDGLITTIPSLLLDGERAFTARFVATDNAGNRAELSAELYLDTLPPRLELFSPANDSIYNASAKPEVAASVEDRFLRDYRVRIVLAEDGTEQQIVALGSESSDDISETIDLSTLGEGNYLLELSATDLNGLAASTTVAFVVDNTPPEVAINVPAQNGYITEASSVNGVANDAHFDQYELKIAAGDDVAGAVLNELTVSNRAVSGGTLYTPSSLPEDGRYVFELSAQDKAGNTNTTVRNFTVDTTPPPPVELTSAEFDKASSNIELAWEASSADDVAGYRVYRNGLLITVDLITSSEYADADVPEGSYTYHVQVVDLAGLVSDPSNELTVVADITPPDVRISSPQSQGRVNLVQSVIGTAHSGDDFKIYRLFLIDSNDNRRLIRESSVPVIGDELAQLNTLDFSDEARLTLLLEAEDIYDNKATDSVEIVVDNEPPLAPTLAPAQLQVASPTDALLSWQHNDTAGDRLGFLLYRDEVLLGSDGPVIGDLRPFSIQALTYADLDLVDGTHSWVVYAIDELGNISEPSNVVDLTLDNRSPAAVIINIEDGHEFDNDLYLLAESQDRDIDHVQFEYSHENAPGTVSNWMPIGIANSVPFEISWNTDSLDYGQYRVRAVATDFGGKPDLAPASLAVIKKDVQPPAQVKNLQISTNGPEGTLTWNDNDEPDLVGYHVYRANCEDCEFVLITQNGPITNSSHIDLAGVSFGLGRRLRYIVRAVDVSDNEGVDSDTVAGVYVRTSFAIDERVVGTGLAQGRVVVGSAANGIEKIQFDIGRGPTPPTPITQEFSPAEDDITTDIPLAGPALYNITAVASSDTERFIGEVSRPIKVISQGAPTAPAGLQGVFVNATAQVELTWSPNPPEQQVSGYQILKDGELVQGNELITDVTAFSSHGVGIENSTPLAPELDFWDSNTISRNGVQFGQRWDDPSLVSKIQLQWQSRDQAARTLDYEVLVDGEYVELGTHTKFFLDSTVIIELSKPVLTTSVRFTVRDWESRFRNGRLETMSVFAQTVQFGDRYTQLVDPIPHAEVEYQIRAIDQYGGVGELSQAIKVGVGDVVPPQALVLSLQQQGSAKQLAWTESSEPNSTYRLFANGVEVVTQASTSYSLPKLQNGVYTFTVVAIDPQGNISDPSNEVAVEINEPLLPAPINLQAVYSDLSNEINLTWQFDGQVADVTHYTVYASIGDAQQFDAIDESQNTEYDFSQISQESHYQFYVTATDRSGNESPASNTVGVTIPRVAFAGPPVISLPYDISGTVTAESDRETISGFAEPGSNVALFDGNLQQRGSVRARPIATLSEPLFDATAGSNLILELEQGRVLVRFDFNTSETNFYQLSADGQAEKMEIDGLDTISLDIATVTLASPNALLIELFDGRYWLLDVLTNELTEISVPSLVQGSITRVLTFNEAEQFMVAEIEIDAFTGEFAIYRIDLQTLALQTLISSAEMANLFGAIYAQHPQSNTFVSFTVDSLGEQVLRVTDVLTGLQSERTLNQTAEIVEVGDWSPDGSQLVLLSDNGVSVNFDALNTQTLELVRLPLAQETGFVYWLSDRFVVSTQIVDFDRPERLVLIDLQNGAQRDIGELPMIAPTPLDPLAPIDPFAPLFPVFNSYFIEGWAERGASFFLSNEDTGESREYRLAGSFVFSDIELEQGLNTFSALSISSDQSVSELSNEVPILYDRAAVQLPDLRVSLSVDRPAVMLGDTATVELTVSNASNTASEASVLTLLQTAPDGSTLEFIRKEVGALAANSSITLDVSFFAQVLGTHALFARIDADNTVLESDENNNTTLSAVEVLASLDPRLSIDIQPQATGGFSFPIEEQIIGTVTLFNPGRAVTGTWNIEVIDAQGQLVDLIETIEVANLNLGASIDRAFAWNSEGIFPGDYQIRTRFQPASVSRLITRTASFSLYEDISLKSALSTNKLNFTDNEQVILTASVSNGSSVVSLTEADLTVEIRDNQGASVFQQTDKLVNLIAGAQVQLPFFWNTGVTPAGEYTAHVSVTQAGQQLSAAETRFIVQASNTLLGTLSLSSNRLTALETLEYDSQVMNSGNASAGPVEVAYELVSGATAQELGTQNVGMLAPSTATLLSSELALTGYSEGAFLLRLIAITDNGVARTVLDEEPFFIQEVTPPNLTVIAPEQGDIVSSAGLIARFTAQDTSGVNSVEYRLNNGPWLTADLSILDVGFYEANLSHLSEGQQLLQARATDNRDNVSAIRTVNFEIDNTPPQITVLNIQEQQSFEGSVEPVVSVRDLNLEQSNIWVDGVILNGPITEVGTHRIVIEAIDKANNSSRMERLFTVERSASLAANDDVLQLRRGVWGTVRVLENDNLNFISDGVVEVTKQPNHGSLVKVANGTYNYFPSLRFVGRDSFEYRLASEAAGLSATAAVNVDVAPSASCSFVADHSANAGDVVVLQDWAKNEQDTRSLPRYRIEILGTSNDAVFAPGGLPAINYPGCDLRYTPKATARGQVTVRYRIVDQASNGRSYTSQTRTFVLEIISTVDGPVIVPILNLLLGEDDA